MPPARPQASAKLYRVYGALLGLVAAFVGGTIGYFVGTKLAFGYRFDWYRYDGPAAFADTALLLPVAALSAGLAIVLVPLFTMGAFRVWDHRLKKAKPPAEAQGARTRDTQVVGLMLGLALVMGGFTSLAAHAALFGLGVDLVGPAGYRDVMAASGAFAGFFAAFFAFAWTGDGLAKGRIVKKDGENFLGKVSVFSSRHAAPAVGVVLALSLVMGYGVTLIDTNVDVAEVLPRGNGNTTAAQNLTEKFKSSFTQQATVMVRTAPQDDWAADRAEFMPFAGDGGDNDSISDEVYVRAMAQMASFFLTYEDEERGKSPFVGTVALNDFYAIINWTLAGGTNAPPESYSLPPADNPLTAQQYKIVHEGVWAAIPETADAVISPDGRQSAVLFTVSSTETMSTKEIGQWALFLRDAYVEWAENNPDEAYQVWTGENAPKFSVDIPIANAHSSELAAHDFKTLLPFIALFIIVTLLIGFRDVASIIAAFSALAAAVVITFGAMGYMRIPLSTLNMTVLPLIMGVGIDYSIHMVNEYLEQRSEGKSMAEAWRFAGSGSALALFVATLTTTSGLLIMIVSPSLIIAQLGLLAAIAMVSCFTLSIVFIPALMSVLGGGKTKKVEYKPSVLMPKLARGVSRTRWAALAFIVLLATAAYGSAMTIDREPFGDPPRNWLEDDPLRIEHEAALKGFYNTDTDDVKSNILIFEGNVNDPQAHAYMDAIEASLRTRGVEDTLEGGENGRIIPDTLRTLPFLVRTYLTVKDGVPGAGGYLVQDALFQQFQDEQANPYPKTEAEIAALLDEVQTTPLAGLAALFYDHPDDEMAMMLFGVRAATYEDSEQAWNQVWAAVYENEHLRPEGMKVSFFGNTAINYLFVAEEVPWLGYMSVATNIIVFGIVLVATRRPLLSIAVASASFLTSLFWIGILPQLGIGLAITLTLPLIFIFSMGSDYTLHLGLRAARTKDTAGTMGTVGKGVLFSFLTTEGAFIIFTQISNIAVRKTMIATVIAIGVVMLTTLLLVPIFYPVRKNEAGDGGDRGRTVPAGRIAGLEDEDSVTVPVHGRRAPAPAEDGSRDAPTLRTGARDDRDAARG